MPSKTSTKKQKKRTHTSYTILIMLVPLLIIGAYVFINQQEKNQERALNKELTMYLPIYKEAQTKYGVPWYVLAAHHRVETKFSTVKTMVSSAGAIGPMQFMPCSFVGWKHPSCSGNGKGNIPEKDLTNPAVINKYGGYGVDADGDGKADPWSPKDAIFSAANYLAHNGASDGQIEKAVYSYNHSEKYVKDVLAFAKQYQQEF